MNAALSTAEGAHVFSRASVSPASSIESCLSSSYSYSIKDDDGEEVSHLNFAGIIVAQIVLVMWLTNRVMQTNQDIEVSVSKYNATLLTFGLYLSPLTGMLHVAPPAKDPNLCPSGSVGDGVVRS
jgi:hypothetical protein